MTGVDIEVWKYEFTRICYETDVYRFDFMMGLLDKDSNLFLDETSSSTIKSDIHEDKTAWIAR